MNTIIKTSIERPLWRPTFILIVLALASFAISPEAHAVVPPPDGGYPGGSTAEGQDALLSLTTGIYNTAIGWLSLSAITTGRSCTGVGTGTLIANTADNNTATGALTLLNNTTGTQNTADGAFALATNTTGNQNTANGYNALKSNTTASNNTANGAFALFNNTAGSFNTASGYQALWGNTTGGHNTAHGSNALKSNTTGFDNTAVGAGAMSDNITGTRNTAIGSGALPGSQFLEDQNTAIGNNALGSLGFGIATTAVGADAMSNSFTSQGNTAVGVRALQNTLTFGFLGINNTGVGADTLVNNTAGYGNIALGYLAGNNVTDAANVICIGAAGENVSNTCYIGNIYSQVSSRGTAVFVNSDGKLGTFSSSRRFKDEIKPMEDASAALFALKPVTFRYKKEIDSQRISQFGLVAEDVEAVNPDLVVRDKKGQVDTVRYEAVNAMLLNEFLKEHKNVQELKKEIAALAITVREQRVQIQQIGSQLELRNPAAKVVLSNP